MSQHNKQSSINVITSNNSIMYSTQQKPFNFVNSKRATRRQVSFTLDTEGSKNWVLNVDGTKYEVWKTTLVVTNRKGYVIDVQPFKFTLNALRDTEDKIWKEIAAKREDAQ